MIDSIKLLLLGDSSVGKTSLCSKLKEGDINYQHYATIGVDYHACYLERGIATYKLFIYDTAGLDRYTSLIPSYMNRIDIIIIMYDLNNNDSHKSILRWLNFVSVYNSTSIPIILVGNKTDLPINVDMELIYNITQLKERITFHEMSIKFDKNFNKLFDIIIDKTKNREIVQTQLNQKKSCIIM